MSKISGKYYLMLASVLYILLGIFNLVSFMGVINIDLYGGIVAANIGSAIFFMVCLLYAGFQIAIGAVGLMNCNDNGKGTLPLVLSFIDIFIMTCLMGLTAIAVWGMPWSFVVFLSIAVIYIIGAIKMGASDKAKAVIMKFVCYFMLVALFVICIIPVYMLLINSTRDSFQILGGISLLPGSSFMDNWRSLADLGIDVRLGIRNSSIVAFSSTFLTVYFSMLTAYAVVVYDFKFKNVFFVLILGMIMVPGQLYLTGFFRYMNTLGLLNNYIPMIVPAIAAPGSVFFFKQYLDASVSHELIQAARIDGASEWGIFNKIVMPLSAPGIFTMAIFSFVGSWNAFMGPLFLVGGDPDLATLPLIMQRLQGDTFRRDFGAIYFGMAFTLIPILIVYAAFSKFIITGISLGAMKE
jgi:multiple sugar transport system permease protein